MLRRKIILYIIICAVGCFTAPLHSQQSIDLKDYSTVYNFTGEKIVRIKKGDRPNYMASYFDDSKWDTVSLPSNWNGLFPGWRDICWYRIHVSFPENYPGNTMGVRLGVIHNADKVYFNGELIGQSGEFPPERELAYDKIRIYELPGKLIVPGEDNVIAVRVSGLFHDGNGPCKGNFLIGPYPELHQSFLTKEFIDVFFVVIYIFVGLYIALFYIRRSVDREYLFFSLFSLCCAVYFFLRTQIKYQISEDFYSLKKIEYIILFFAFVILMEFMTFYFKRKHRFSHWIFYGITAVNILLIVPSWDAVFWHHVLHYSVQPSWIIPLAYFSYIIYHEFPRNREAKMILAGVIVLALTTINDTLVHRLVYDFVRLSNYGFSFMIVGITVLIRNRFFNLQDEIEDLKNKDRAPKNSPLYSENKIKEALDYIEDNYADDISREEIAKEIGVHPDHLGKAFKQHTGKRINDYINELKIKDAAGQLIRTEYNIIDIAYSVGFESMSTFYRVFQKVMGESPSNYREKFSGNNKS